MYNDYYRTYGGAIFGWQSIIYPHGSYFIVNVPTVVDSKADQLVMNTQTGAWCRWLSIDAVCWGTANEQLYYGRGDGSVWQADTGYLDNLDAINWELMTSWDSHNVARDKFYTAVRPSMLTGGAVSYSISVDTDFNTMPPQGILSSPTAIGTGAWPMTWSYVWPPLNQLDARWRSVGAFGTWASIHMKGQVFGRACRINGFDLVGMSGGFY
jgi:hypothetical protein